MNIFSNKFDKEPTLVYRGIRGLNSDKKKRLGSDDECLPLTLFFPSSDDGEDNDVSSSTTNSLCLELHALPSHGNNLYDSNFLSTNQNQTDESSLSNQKPQTEIEREKDAESSCNLIEFEDDEKKSTKAADPPVPPVTQPPPSQDWSFTLYDFDGRGKVTKEDLSMLMKSLHEVLGSSLHLRTGARAFQLRLSLQPSSLPSQGHDTPLSGAPSGPNRVKRSCQTKKHSSLRQQGDSRSHPRSSGLNHNNLSLQLTPIHETEAPGGPPSGGQLPASSTVQFSKDIDQTEKGKPAVKDIDQSEKSKPSVKDIDQSEKSKSAAKEFDQSEKKPATSRKKPHSASCHNSNQQQVSSNTKQRRHLRHKQRRSMAIQHVIDWLQKETPRSETKPVTESETVGLAAPGNENRAGDKRSPVVCGVLTTTTASTATCGGTCTAVGPHSKQIIGDDVALSMEKQVVVHEHRHVHEHHHHYHYHHHYDG